MNEKYITEKTEEIIKTLPAFAEDYFLSRSMSTSPLTRLNYAHDLRIFFSFLFSYLEKEEGEKITIEDMRRLKGKDIERYVVFLRKKNGERGIARKISSLSSFFNYFVKHEMIEKNPCALIEKPKLHDIDIIYLTPNETADFLNVIEYGSSSFSPKQKEYWEKTRKRDLAIASVFLNTGIRVSELTFLNISDVDIEECKLYVKRKGGNRGFVALGDETIKAICEYIQERGEEEGPFFFSTQKKRMSAQAVENLIGKYAKLAGIRKNITPHKLRKTCGTSLYRETGDIYAVASLLGHKNVATTTKHYAAQTEDTLMSVRNRVKLR